MVREALKDKKIYFLQKGAYNYGTVIFQFFPLFSLKNKRGKRATMVLDST
jgi:hypothetical protein